MKCNACDSSLDPKKDNYHVYFYEHKGSMRTETECDTCYWGGSLDDVEGFGDLLVDNWYGFFSEECSEEERDLEVMKKMAELSKELSDRLEEYFREKISPYMDARVAKLRANAEVS